ncbi:MAG: 4Fe-4S binding protein [Candidatus Tectomicrobia bacterium]|uniref:4Fe-4S binding protein n=1 Tax=Tectimicrobiota bacterium TaxID=2528274 RepID=A0A933LQD9_UNCTE|nr:4Fe-4S binding protein [Candidatus Tectomicrobia bacterium]
MSENKPIDIYDDLLDYYLALRQPVPNFKEVKEIVKLRFTEKEAQVALNLPHWYKPGLTSTEVASKMGTNSDEMEKLLDRKAREGVFFAREKKDTGEVLYSLWDFGRLSAFYEKDRTDELILKIRELREKMWKAGQVHNLFPPSGYPMSRVIPYPNGIAEGEEITPTDTIEFTIEKTRAIAVAGCPCRSIDQRCNHEVMTCIHFDDMADYFVKYQGGRYLRQEEIKDFAEQNVKNGLVITLANYQSIFYGYCFCDPCCCVIMRPYIEENNSHALDKSNFRPRFNHDKCTRCQKCLKACPVKAIGKSPAPWGKPKKEDKMFLLKDRCIGCGVCVAQCEFEALKLYRMDNKVPEQTPADAIKRNLAERMI